MIELAVFDIDGVLLYRNNPIMQTLEAAKKLQSRGIRCSFATGRSYYRVRQVISLLYPDGPMIIEDGGRITQQDGIDIINHPIDKETIRALEPILVGEAVMYSVFCSLTEKKYRFFVSSDRVKQFIIDNFGYLTEGITLDSGQFLQWVVAMGCAKITIKVENGCFLGVPIGVNWSYAEGSFYNIKANGIDKGTGLKELARLYEVPMNRIMVVGNDENDIPIFQQGAAIKIAVIGETPIPQLLKLATHVTTADELYKLLLPGQTGNIMEV